MEILTKTGAKVWNNTPKQSDSHGVLGWDVQNVL